MTSRFTAAAIALLALAALALVSGCATHELQREGVVDVDAGRFEEGLQKMEQASRDDPDNLAYRYDLQARRAAVLQLLTAAADRARADGNPDEAERIYRRALAISPGSEPALQGIKSIEADRRHAEVLAAAQKDFDAGKLDEAEVRVRNVLAEDPESEPASDLQAKIEIARGPVSTVPRLRAGDKKSVTLEFRDAPTKMVFEVLSRQTGINFIFDKDVRSDGKTSIFVREVPVEQAVNLVLGQNQLARQVLSDNMVLIYPNTAAKQKEYQDQIVKTLYLTNADPKKAQELLKTMLGAKTLFVDDKADLVVIRDTPEMVHMAEKLVASLDMIEPEVMMEVEVLEVNRSLMDDLGIVYPTTATMTMTPLSGKAFTLNDIGSQTSSTITFTPPPSVTLNAMKQASTTNTLASPRIRSRNHEKAKIQIGSRVPVITQSVTPTAGTAVTTGSVQYLDVGLMLTVEPDVHQDGVVAIKVDLEVSNILKEVRVPSSGTLAYEIGTRNASTLLSLKDGETQILGGLISNNDKRNSATVPGLGDIPVVGRLFGDKSSTKDKSEIVLSITPRIIRASIRPPGSTTEFWYGTESSTRGAPLVTQGSAPAADAGTPTLQPVAAVTPVAPPAPPPARTGYAALAYTTPPINTTMGGAMSAPPAQSAAASAAPAPAAESVATPAPAAPAAQSVATPEAAAPAAENVATAMSATPAAERMPAATPAAVAAASSAPVAAAATAPAAAAQPAARPVATAPPGLSWDGPAQVKVGEQFAVALNLASEEPLVRIRSQAHYDRAVLRLDSAEAGAVVPGSLQAASAPKINAGVGNAQMVVVASKDSPVIGSGSLLVLHFTALAASGGSPISLQFSGTGGDGRDAGVATPRPLSITVNP